MCFCLHGASDQRGSKVQYSYTGMIIWPDEIRLFHLAIMCFLSSLTGIILAAYFLQQWVFGQSTYAFESPGRIICAYTQNGTWHLARIDTSRCSMEPIETAYTHISQVRAGAGKAVFRGGTGRLPAGIVELDLETGESQVLRQSFEVKTAVGRCISAPEAIEFPTENSLTAHGLFYPPYNPDYLSPRSVERKNPPLPSFASITA